MVYKILSKLFSKDYAGRYNPHPVQMVYPIFIMAIGWMALTRDGWIVFGISVFALGLLLGVTIIMAINWDKVTEYWEQINEHIKLMMKVNDPDIWQALGYKKAPSIARIEERVIDEKGNFQGFKFREVDLSPATLQLIADNVLSGKKFSETNMAKLISAPKFRKIQKKWKKDGYLKPNVVKDGKEVPTQGYSFSRKGIDMLYEYASEGVKLELKKKGE